MPSIAHLILGAVVGTCLYYISEGKFSKTHAFIFFMNNYLGPDVGWVLGLGAFTHSLIFWPVFAFVLSYFYHYFTRFTIKIDDIKNIELIDLERYKLSYINVYFLVVAGGTLHNYLDGVMNRGGEFFIFPQINGFNGVSWTIEDFMMLWETGFLGSFPIFALIGGIILIFGFIFLFVWFLKKESNKVGILVLSYVGFFMIYFFLFGSISTGEHSDAGAIIYIGLFWAIPLICCALSVKDFGNLKIVEKEEKKKRNKNLPLITAWLFFVGTLGAVSMIIGFFINNSVISYVFERYGADIPSYLSPEVILALALILESLLLTLSFISLTCAIGLKIRNEKIWKVTIYCHLLFSWTIIGLYIACALSDNNVKGVIKSGCD